MNQQIRFCRSFDGTRIAYAITGQGPLLVGAPHWLTHLEYAFESPIWRPYIEAYNKSYTYLRMDQRGCGLSDWDIEDLSLEAWVRDLEAVVDAAGFDRFALLGGSQGGPIAIEYAVRHPDRVTHMVLIGSYGRGSRRRGLPPDRIAEIEAQLKLVEAGWGRADPAYRHMFSTQFMPGATLEQLNAVSEMARVSSSPRNAVRALRVFQDVEVMEPAARVRCPTLLLHARGDRRVPFEEGRLLASTIPGARLVALDTDNHILSGDEPAFRVFIDELHAFVRGKAGRVDGFPGLTAREYGILEHIAQGLDNAQIAARLGLSEKTVRNYVTQIFDKIEVENRAQAIVRARDAGLGRSSGADSGV